MTSTEDYYFLYPSEPSLLSDSAVDFHFEEQAAVALDDFGACSSSPLPAASFTVPCPLSVEELAQLAGLNEDSLAISTAAAIAASDRATSAAAPFSLSIQLPTEWPPRQTLAVVTPRSPESTRTSSRKKKPSEKAAAANSMSAIPPPPVVKERDADAAPAVLATMSQQPSPPRPTGAPSAVQSSIQPPPAPQSASSLPPSPHHHIHPQQQPTNKPPPGGPSLQENTGRWTAEEHRLFLAGLEQHGKGWKKIASLIKSRTVVQIRTHAQKYFQKLAKARQNGDQVGAVMDGSGAGGVNGAGGVGNGGVGQHVPMANRDEVGGTSTPSSAYPHIVMRTISHHNGQGGNMALGTDPTSLAAAAGHVGIADSGAVGGGRKRRAGSNPSGSTKRRAIGSVVRSSVREGRNIKRQIKAAARRRKQTEVDKEGEQLLVEGEVNVVDVPNPLPSISHVLDPYMPLPPPPGALAVNGPNTMGRNQMVHTATHPTLPMAALEDAVFRLLTPATGAPAPPVPPAQNISDPLAPNPVKYSGQPQGAANPSPIGVDHLYPSWVDAKNPPAWYNDGGDIETLLEDAECLNWLTDTGDLDETYPPAVVEPSPMISGEDDAGGSHESLSFLMDPPQEGATTDDAATADSATIDPSIEEVDSKPAAVTTTTEEYASATEAMAAAQQQEKVAAKEEQLFPDLDMGDDQAFVSALLDNQGQSHLSFSRLHSELHGEEQQ